MNECYTKRAGDPLLTCLYISILFMSVGGFWHDNDNGGDRKHQLFWTASCQ
jgi:hypothetical protein